MHVKFIENNRVQLTAHTHDESKLLITVLEALEEMEALEELGLPEFPEEKPKKKRKMGKRDKKCPICGKKFIKLNSHMTRSHKGNVQELLVNPF